MEFIKNEKVRHANNGYNPLLGLVFYPKTCVFLLGWIPTSENSCHAKAWQRNFTRNGIIAETLANIKKNMKKNILIIILFISVIVGCSKDENLSNPTNNIPKLVLTLLNNNSYSSNFGLNFNSDLENVKLIWNNANTVDLDNSIGVKEITGNPTEITINNLEQNTTYYFRLIGLSDGELLFSNIVSITTNKIDILINQQIMNSVNTGGGYILDIIEKNDGFIVATAELISYSNNTSIRISKIDNQFNLQWTFVIDESIDADELAGILELNDNTFIGIARKFNHSSLGLLNHEVYGFKFNLVGDVLWTKYYNAPISDANTNLNYTVKFKNFSNELKVVFWADSTYNGNSEDAYYRELKIDNNGEIISTQILENSNDDFLNIYYDKYGNKFNYGTDDLNPSGFVSSFSGIIDKYDINNNLIWQKHYNDDLFGSDKLDNLLITDNNIINIGAQVDQYGLGTAKDEYRLIHFRDNQGNELWEFAESKDDFLYQGKDLIVDFDNNILALYFDIYYPNTHVYNIATLMKFDINGNLLWRFQDGEDFNNDKFHPQKVFSINNEYLIFGINEGDLWLKKIKVN